MMKKLIIIAFSVLIGFTLFGCHETNEVLYKTFTMDEGAVQFSFECLSTYEIDGNSPAESTGNYLQRTATFSIQSTPNKDKNIFKRILVGAGPPDHITADVLSAVQRAERNAATWKGYTLLAKCETEVDGYKAYRLDYQIGNIVPALAGVSNQYLYDVYREVHFDANGYIWIIQIHSDSSLKEDSNADFEHVLNTIKIRD